MLNTAIYSRRTGFVDATGAVVSWLCAVHCICAPLLVSMLPTLGLGFLASAEAEFAFIAASGVIAAVSLVPGFFGYHRRINTLLLFLTGFSLLVFGEEIFGESIAGRIAAAVTGAAFITAAHLINRRLCRKCINCVAEP
jgi:hypothetical protein